MIARVGQNQSRLRAKWAMPTLLACTLSACSIIPDGGPRLTPNAEAILDRIDDEGSITLLYDTALMNRPEAEVYAQQVCEAQDLTLDQLRHPAADAAPSSTVTFACRRPFG